MFEVHVVLTTDIGFWRTLICLQLWCTFCAFVGLMNPNIFNHPSFQPSVSPPCWCLAPWTSLEIPRPGNRLVENCPKGSSRNRCQVWVLVLRIHNLGTLHLVSFRSLLQFEARIEIFLLVQLQQLLGDAQLAAASALPVDERTQLPQPHAPPVALTGVLAGMPWAPALGVSS